MKLLTFKVSGHSENNTKTIVNARNFKLIIDEPESLGGNNEGATPVEFLLAALVGCLTVVGNLVAKEMGFVINDLQIDVEGDMNPAKFLGKSDEQRTGYQEIRGNVKVKSKVDATILEKWLKEVERRCPVSDNLFNNTPLKLSIK